MSKIRAKPTGKHAKGKLRPHTWRTGPDPLLHEMYHPWQMAKAQAKFRDEEFTLTFEEYAELWRPHWHQRGRKINEYCMTRHDITKGWTRENAWVVERSIHQDRHIKNNIAAGRVRGYKNK